ncbi:hypothetical protein [Gemmatimonas sp.]|jgi:hypothetical protein|uniref:hypothetical protein n=1 Tax=Gemmatimonas sp. TaxID=1962908 RepID=UPI0037C16D89
MGLWADWQAARAQRHRVEMYLNYLLREPDDGAMSWLFALAPDMATARREFHFARRAIGLIVAERDALDDRTHADVTHQLAPVLAAEARRAPADGLAWNERWRAYTAALAVRGTVDSPATRLARVMLSAAGVEHPDTAGLLRATQFVQETRGAMNEALRHAFGAAALPEDVRPSALRG